LFSLYFKIFEILLKDFNVHGYFGIFQILVRLLGFVLEKFESLPERKESSKISATIEKCYSYVFLLNFDAFFILTIIYEVILCGKTYHIEFTTTLPPNPFQLPLPIETNSGRARTRSLLDYFIPNKQLQTHI